MRFIIATTVFSSLVATWMAMPDAWQSIFPTWLVKIFAFGDVLTGVGAGVSRVVKQNLERDDA
jgi:hypothetical protein